MHSRTRPRVLSDLSVVRSVALITVLVGSRTLFVPSVVSAAVVSEVIRDVFVTPLAICFLYVLVLLLLAAHRRLDFLFRAVVLALLDADADDAVVAMIHVHVHVHVHIHIHVHIDAETETETVIAVDDRVFDFDTRPLLVLQTKRPFLPSSPRTTTSR